MSSNPPSMLLQLSTPFSFPSTHLSSASSPYYTGPIPRRLSYPKLGHKMRSRRRTRILTCPSAIGSGSTFRVAAAAVDQTDPVTRSASSHTRVRPEEAGCLGLDMDLIVSESIRPGEGAGSSLVPSHFPALGVKPPLLFHFRRHLIF